MFGRSVTLFRLLGFEVKVDASWLIIASLVIWSLAAGLFPARFPQLPPATYWWMGVLGALGLFASIVFHEFSHSLVARYLGLEMKGITLFIFGGVAEMEEEPPNPKVEFFMAAAGPLASIVLALFFRAIALSGLGTWSTPAIGVLQYLSWINWVLAIFNLIPAFPLDGGRILRAALWRSRGDLRRATRVAASCGSIFGTILAILGFLQLFTNNFIGAVWMFLIGMFLRAASRGSYRQVVTESLLKGQPVRRFMTVNPVTVPPDTSVQDLIDDYIYRYHYKLFPVVNSLNELLGCVTIDQVKQMPQQERRIRRVADIVRPCSAQNTIQADTDAAELLSRMNRTGNGRFVVLEDNTQRVAGIVSSEDLARFLSLKSELDEESRKAA